MTDSAAILLATLIRTYDNTLIQYNQAQIDCTNSETFIVIQGQVYDGGKAIRTDTETHTLNDCKTKCSAISNCTGATYKSDVKTCLLKSGDPSLSIITDGTSNDGTSNDYAIIKGRLYQLKALDTISTKLIETNRQIVELITNKTLFPDTNDEEKQVQTTTLNENYDLLSRKNEILNTKIKELEKIAGVETDTEIIIAHNYYSYGFFLIIAIFLGAFTIAINYTSNAYASNSVHVPDKDYQQDKDYRQERDIKPDYEPEYEEANDDDNNDYEKNQRGGKYIKKKYHYVFLLGLIIIIFYSILQILCKI